MAFANQVCSPSSPGRGFRSGAVFVSIVSQRSKTVVAKGCWSEASWAYDRSQIELGKRLTGLKYQSQRMEGSVRGAPSICTHTYRRASDNHDQFSSAAASQVSGLLNGTLNHNEALITIPGCWLPNNTYSLR
ncbi:hypothetical protein FB451DRAFT_1186505 [Mycena latifolia]|nr:hypothetical protein FB451DRAFT_1186505 [Mycena latifolia]